MPDKSIRYKLTRGDILAFQFRGVLCNRMVMAIGCAAVFFVVCRNYTLPGLGPHNYIVTPVRLAVALFLGILTLAILAAVQLAILAFNIDRHLLLQQTLTITADGLSSISESSKTRHRWAHIFKITSTRKYLLVYLGQTSASIIPKRCFGTPDEAAAFEQELRQRWQGV